MKKKLFEEKVCDYEGYSIYHVIGKEPDLYEVWKNGEQVYSCDTENEAIEWIESLTEAVNEPTEVSMELYFPNGSRVTFEGDVVSAIAYYYGETPEKARRSYKGGKYTKDEIQKAITYWVNKTDGNGIKESTLAILNGVSVREVLLNQSSKVIESRKFVVGKKFKYTDKYGVTHDCTVLSKDLFNEEDYDDYAIGTMTFSYPTMGNPHKETVRIFKSEQSDSYGDEYFISNTEKLKSGVGIASWAFPDRITEAKSVDFEKELKKFETDDYQNRDGDYPDSGVPDTISVWGNTLTFTFKNTSEGTAKNWVKHFLSNKGFSLKCISASQTGDYEDDWVDVYCEVDSYIGESKSYIKEDDREYWDYVHLYGDEEEREKAADYFDVTPSAFDEPFDQFYGLDESRNLK